VCDFLGDELCLATHKHTQKRNPTTTKLQPQMATKLLTNLTYVHSMWMTIFTFFVIVLISLSDFFLQWNRKEWNSQEKTDKRRG
jgi:hypothetical protein